MAAESPAGRLLRRLDADVTRSLDGRQRVVLAFSGGLGSLILAALVRKRCDLVCEVVGLPGSADAQAASVAETFLDYPIHTLRPTPANALRTVRAILAQNVAMSTSEALSLAPLLLVEAHHPRDRILSGFGLTWGSARVRSFLASRSAVVPGLRIRATAPPPRARLLNVADLLGLPDTFSRAARRSPAEGSGVGPAIRALAHAESVSLARFLRPRLPFHENH